MGSIRLPLADDAAVAWRHGLDDYAQPYKLQRLRHDQDRLAALEKQLKALSERATKSDAAEADAPILGPGLGGRLMLTAGPRGGMAPPPPMQFGQPTSFGAMPGMFSSPVTMQ